MTNALLRARKPDRDKIKSSHPAPWCVEETAACFVVRDRNGRALSYVYFKDQHGRRSAGTVFTRDEARHLAAAVAKLPDLLALNQPHTAVRQTRAASDCRPR
jgi:hypothetical protein